GQVAERRAIAVDDLGEGVIASRGLPFWGAHGHGSPSGKGGVLAVRRRGQGSLPLLVYGKRKSTEKGKASERGPSRPAARPETSVKGPSRGGSASRAARIRRPAGNSRGRRCVATHPRVSWRCRSGPTAGAANRPWVVLSGTPPGGHRAGGR